MGKLTVKRITALSEPGRYSDGDGLHLRIDSAGRRYWVLRVQGKKARDVNIGPAARITLAQARERARAIREAVLDGTYDARPDRPAVTFEEAALTVHGMRAGAWRNAKHGQQWIQTLRTHAFPTLGGKSVADIERADIVEALTPIWLATPETARRVLQRIDVVLRWAVGMGHRQAVVDMRLVRGALPRQKSARRNHLPALPWAEVPAFYASLDYSRASPQVRAALRWHILTAARPGNTNALRWDQVDFARAVWTIAADEMKMQVPHRVPLPPVAMALLAGLRQYGEGVYVFALPGDDKPLSGDTLRMAMRRMGLDATPHGFRSSFKDWSLSTGWPDHMSEIALAHSDKDEVRAAYARSDLLDERRAMMTAWADFVTGSTRQAGLVTHG
ncbi:MAG: integrase arm-type DNA-binding domain-containing protein [Sphingomonadaceae bacterium]